MCRRQGCANWIHHEASDDLYGAGIYIEIFGAFTSRIENLNIHAMPRRDAKKHEGKITLTANRIVQFTNQDDVPVVAIHWQPAKLSQKAIIQMYDNSGHLIRTMTIYK